LKKNYFLLLSGIAIVFLLSGCSIEKRRYSSGYHVEWNHAKPGRVAERFIPKVKSISVQQVFAKERSVQDDRLLREASLSNYTTVLKHTSHRRNAPVIHPADCDVITLKNGDEIRAKVLEVSTDEIKYKLCNDSTGISYGISSSDVFMIVYQNGTKDIIRQEQGKNNKFSEKEDKGMFGVMSFVLFIAALFLTASAPAFLILATFAIILAIIGLGKKRRLKFFAALTLVLATLFIVLLLALAAAWN